jgi:DNA-directed RNA polymerase specialized sigma24 family protein
MAPTLGQHDPMPMIMDRLTNIRALSDALSARLFDAKLRIERAIDGLPSIQRQVMRARYIDGKCWDGIADEMAYSAKQLQRIHNKALESLKLKHSKRKPKSHLRSVSEADSENMLLKSCNND